MSFLSERTYRLVAAVCTVGIISIPFFSVTIPPITDLAQHLSQIRLFREALGSEANRLTIQYDNPYWLGYLIPLTLWELLRPIAVARWTMLLLAVSWVVAVHLLASTQSRPPISAVLASLFIFSEPFYWGYLTFIAGFPVFLGWFWFTLREVDWPVGRRIAGHIVGLTLLYYSHILWLAFGLVWMALHTLIRTDWAAKDLRLRGCFAAIASAVGVVWYAHMPKTDIVSETVWLMWPWQRLLSDWPVRATFGMLRGYVGYIAMGLIILWCGMAFFRMNSSAEEDTVESSPRPKFGTVDKDLLLAAGLLICLGYVLPDKLALTNSFASRWLAPGFILLVLGLPLPPARRLLLGTFTTLLALSLSLFTANVWFDYEQHELSGLKEAVTEVSEDARVLGLDFRKVSPRLFDRPYLQMFAYSQVAKSADLNFSFADRAQFPVIYDPPRKTPWTPGMEWHPERFRLSDLQHFEYVIVNAAPQVHRKLAATKYLMLRTDGKGFWQTYEVTGSVTNQSDKASNDP